MNEPPGWYPDAQQPGQVRWWDGTTWTADTQAATSFQAPGGRPPSGPTTEPTGRRWKTWQLATATGLALLVGFGAGSAGDDSTDLTAVDSETTTTTEAEARQDSTPADDPVVTSPPVTDPPVTAPPTTEAPAEPVEIGRYSGSADTETDDLTVVGSWQVSWSVSGGAGVSVAVRTPGGELIDAVSIDPGESSSQFRQGCICYLEISTFGSSYEIVVTDLPG